MLEFIGYLLYCIGDIFKYSEALLIGIMSLDGVIISILFPKILEMRDNINKLYCSENVNKYVNNKFNLSGHIIGNLFLCLIVLALFDDLRYVHVIAQLLICSYFAYCIYKTYKFYKKNTEMYMVNNLEKQIKKDINYLIRKNNKNNQLEDRLDILKAILVNPLYNNERYFDYANITEQYNYLCEICKNLSNFDFNKTQYYKSNKDKLLILKLENSFLSIKVLNIMFEIYEVINDKSIFKYLKNIQIGMYQILIYFSSKQNCQNEVNYILDRLYCCMCSDKNSLIIYYYFYTIIFDRFRKEKFNVIYLDKFNSYAFCVIKRLLDLDDLKTFKNVVDFSIGKSLDIYDIEEENKDKIKINKFRNLFLKITCLALYKKNYEALDILFNFHSPKDSTMHLINKDILPHSLQEVFEWVFNNKGMWLEDIEDNHGIQSYYEILKYLLILRSLYEKNAINENISLFDLDNITLSDLHTLQQLNSDALKRFHPNIKYNDKDLEQSRNYIVSIVNNIFDNHDLLNIIGIKEPNKIKNNYIDILYKISELANEKEEDVIINTPCSIDKINSIRSEILSNYSEKESLLSILKQYCLVSICKYNNFKNSEILHYDITLPKEIFFNDYSVSYVGVASNYSAHMCRCEDRYILEKIREKAKIGYIENLEDLIYNYKNKDDLFIILNYADLFNLRSLQKTMDITLKDKYLFSEEEKSKFNKYYNLKNFSGIMIFKDISIPIYSSFMGDDKSQLFLLSKKYFCKIVEYVYDGKGKEYFDDKSKVFCQLSEMEDKKHVYLQLYKKIDLNLSNEFEGYMISLKDI